MAPLAAIFADAATLGRWAQFLQPRTLEVAPGAATPLHDHWYEQEMYMPEGRGVLVGDKGEKPLEPGTVMWVPPYERHQIKNTGTSTMKFICCVPQKRG